MPEPVALLVSFTLPGMYVICGDMPAGLSGGFGGNVAWPNTLLVCVPQLPLLQLQLYGAPVTGVTPGMFAYCDTRSETLYGNGVQPAPVPPHFGVVLLPT